MTSCAHSRLHRECRLKSRRAFPAALSLVSAKPPTPDVLLRCRERSKRARSRHGAYHFHFDRGLATSRAQSTKSSATELSARFFRVTIPFGRRAIGSSAGKILSSERLVISMRKPGKSLTERPVANRLMRVATRLFTVHLFEQKGAAGGTCGQHHQDQHRHNCHPAPT